MPQPVMITIVSDVVCPWCYIAKHNLACALEDVPSADVQLDWRPHQLDPDIPPGGIDRKAHLAAKFSNSGRLFAIQQTLMEAAGSAGLEFHFERITRTPNTLDAHRLIHWARGQNRDSEMVEALMAAYFQNGADIGDRSVLATLAARAGLDAELVQTLLDSDADCAAVQADIEKYRAAGVSAVPCFIFNNHLAVMGAQPPDVLRRAYDQVRAATAD